MPDVILDTENPIIGKVGTLLLLMRLGVSHRRHTTNKQKLNNFKWWCFCLLLYKNYIYI